MASERLQRRIERLLDQIEEAADRQEWDLVLRLARQVLALDPENVEAPAFIKVAIQESEESASESPSVHPVDSASDGQSRSANSGRLTAETVDQPTSFADGRYQVQRFLGEGGKKKVKFGAFVALVGAETAARLPAGPLMACPETRELIRGMLEETAAVAKASGIELKSGYVDGIMGFIDEHVPPTHMGSMYVDLVAEKRLELDAIIGVLVRIGKEQGVPTPISHAVYALLKPFVNGAPAMPSS